MDEKQFEKSTKQFKEEKEKFLNDLKSRDRASHSENKTWKYDHKTGNLIQNKER